jgi:hypothetical protein
MSTRGLNLRWAGRPRLIGLDSSPLHGELLGVERLEQRARALAAGITLARVQAPL